MRIAVDYNAAVRQGAGIGRYTRELIAAVVRRAPELRFVLFYAGAGLKRSSPYLDALRRLCDEHPNVEARPLPIHERLLTILWQRLLLPLPLERLVGPIDLLHAPDFVLAPTRRARSILTVHDLTFLIHPETAVPELRRYLGRAVPRSLRRADHVLADSESTRADLQRLLGVDPARVTVVYPGVGQRFQPLADKTRLAEARRRLNLPDIFLLSVGTVEPRKNHVRLLEAFARVAGRYPTLMLLIAGRRGWMAEPIYEAVERLGLRQRVRFLDFVADDDLPLLYNLAHGLVYPALYEGFGFPPLEALACGTPVLASNTSSLPEVVGEAGVLVDPTDIESIAAGIQRLLDDEELVGELRRRGPQQAARFSWDQAAQRTLDIYRQVLG